ncbi:hypothetical protein F7R20_27610 [Pseudomonas brassicacearum subsp. brassicacearum]|nr:hypothetical protein F7R20_27610 [Pseudomonas brassicacearum subsp. brassicacearum]PJH86632.1 hypothetical protein CVG87_23645 [Pseudomonas sp. WCS365]QEO81862.1 hypothetical protein ELZ14_07370 [Pseudomonas brassicacearum]
MSERSITQFFAALKAPLHMMRRSWGAVRDDGAVFLRVWQDRCETHDVYSKGASPAQKLAAISRLPALASSSSVVAQ